MFKKNILRRMIAMALSAIMLMSLMPMMALAEDFLTQDDVISEISEIVPNEGNALSTVIIASLSELDETTVLWQGFSEGQGSLESLVLPSQLTGQDDENNNITISGVTWACDDFNPNRAGYYRFNATLPTGYVLGSGVELPVITAVIGTLGGSGVELFGVGDVTWNSSTVPVLTALNNDKILTIESGASGELIIPNDVSILTIIGAGAGVNIPDTHITITSTNDVTLTIEDLNITAPSGYTAALDYQGADKLTLNLENVSITGGSNSTSMGGHGILSQGRETVINASGAVTLTGGNSIGSTGGGGIATTGRLSVNGDLTAAGGVGTSAPHGSGIQSYANVNISAGSSITATGVHGVWLSQNCNINLGGSLVALAKGIGAKTALSLLGTGKVNFTAAAARLTVEDVNSDAYSDIRIIHSEVGYEFCSTLPTALVNQVLARSSTSQTTIYLDNATDPTTIVWDGGVTGAQSGFNFINMKSGGVHENVTTILVADTAGGTLEIPDGKNTLTIQGITSGVKTIVTDGQIDIINADDVNLTLKDLDITAAFNGYPQLTAALRYITAGKTLTLNCDNVSLTGGGISTTAKYGGGLYIYGSLIVNGDLTTTGGEGGLTGGSYGIAIQENMTVNGDLTTIGGKAPIPGGGIYIKGHLTVNDNLKAIGGEGVMVGGFEAIDGVGVDTEGGLSVNGNMEASGRIGVSGSSAIIYYLAGELNAISTRDVALSGGTVEFTNPAAALTMKDFASSPASNINISKNFAGSADYGFSATGGVTLSGNPANVARGSTTAGTVSLKPAYNLTVNNGTGGGSYVAGAAVSITANAAPAGQMFDKWTGGADAIFAAGARTDESTTINMPSTAVTISATYKALPPNTYSITLNQKTGGTATVSKTNATAGESITLNITSVASNYSFSGWTVIPSTITWTNGNANRASATFTMPNGAVSITPNFTYTAPQNNNTDVDYSSNDSSDDNNSYVVYNSTLSQTSATVEQSESGGHEDVVITLNTNGNTLRSIKIGGRSLERNKDYTLNNNKVTIKGEYLDTLAAGKHTLTFDMSNGADLKLVVTTNTVDTTENKADSTTETEANTAVQKTQWANPFADVKENDWFYEPVKYAYENGLFSGTGAEAFSPQESMTRGMVVTVLGRLASIDTAGYSGESFGDVNSAQYYAPFVKWAAQVGIVSGVGDNNFAPDGNISRQDLAVILARYVEIMGINVRQTRQIVVFEDSVNISNYAEDAVAMMVRAGIISGMPDGSFAPANNATRAEVATVMYRFAGMADR